MPNPTFIAKRTAEARISIATEPALNAFTSLMALYWANEQSGFDHWVEETLHALSPQMAHAHRLVMAGLYFAIAPDRSFSSYPGYLAELQATPPETLRDRILNAYSREYCGDKQPDTSADPNAMLGDLDYFLERLQACFSRVDVAIETEAHHLLNHPQELKDVALLHLTTMWDDFLEDEWRRVEPMLAASVEAFASVNLAGMSKEDSFHAVTGDTPGEHWQNALDNARQIVYVPSAHIGPYSQKLFAEDVLWIFFSARLPAGVSVGAPDLAISEIMPGLNALADGVRLRILHLVAEHGELCTADVMELLDLTQSAAQRHLKQLEATGYLTSWRQDGAKCFAVNHERIEQTFRGVRGLVGRT